MTEPQVGEIEVRSAALVDVSFPKRTIELVVMPYETEAHDVDYHGRSITEICSRGAYAGVEARTGRIKVNRDHDYQRVCGRSVKFHASRDDGLVAECRISRSSLGEDTLHDCADGMLDASAGFGLMRRNGRTGPVVPGAEVWETRSRRRLNHLYLDHIALVPEGAYVGADVLAVRARSNETVAVPATPNLDALWLREQREKLAALDAVYSHQ